MKYRFTVTLRESILDQQGNAVQKALRDLGFDNVSNVRIGKIIDLDVDGRKYKDGKIESLAKAVRNEIMEDVKIEKL